MEATIIIFLIILGLVMALTGLVGSVLPIVPGPTLSFVSLLVLSYAKDWEPYSRTFLIVMAGFTLLVSILDYIVPAAGAKKFGASKYGVWFSIIGMIVGLFFPPFGILIGGFLGAIFGELMAGKDSEMALRAGWGVFVGTIAGAGIKFTFAGIVLFYYIKGIF